MMFDMTRQLTVSKFEQLTTKFRFSWADLFPVTIIILTTSKNTNSRDIPKSNSSTLCIQNRSYHNKPKQITNVIKSLTPKQNV
jgi:hypothetical protein